MGFVYSPFPYGDADRTAAINFLGGTRLEKDRAVLAVFPLFMLFFLLAWLTMLS